MKALKKVNYFFLKYKKNLLYGIFITVIAQFFLLVPPKLINQSIQVIEKANGMATEDNYSQLLKYLLYIILATVVGGILTFLKRQTLIVMSRHIEFDMKNEIYSHYQKMSQNFYNQNRIGDLMNRISEDVSRVRMYFGPAIMYSIDTIIRFTIIIIFMLQVSPKLTFYTLLPLPLLSYLIYYITQKIHIKSTAYQENLSNMSSFVQEFFSGIRVIKANALESKKRTHYKHVVDDSYHKNLALSKINAYFGPLMIFLIGLSNLVVIYVGAMMYISGEIKSIGIIAEFILYVNMLTWPVASVGWVSSLVQEAESSQKRINEFLTTTSEIEENKQPISKQINGKITFENVSFNYPKNSNLVLKNINFTIESGKRVVILGHTGAGKTTLLNLITRFYDASSGRILIDDQDVKLYPINDIRSQISYVPQDVFLFSDTIKNNIKFGSINANDDEIIEVAKLADVDQNIQGFKDKYDTLLGERGINLSGGQKQRISIARALLKESNVLLFDDCLSAVDMETEEKILHNLALFTKNITTIIMSHRISTAILADHIFIIENGSITQSGSHETLISIDGYYKNLYYKQMTINNK
jgi:ATP-binding cassette subfamily B multidrug efflux pump